MSLLQRTAHDFLATLAAETPTPGGGSASALAAALAAALLAMVARLSLKQSAETAGAVLERADRLRATLADLVDEDARAFDAVMAAYRLPKGTPGEQEQRREAVQQALIEASEVPLQVSAGAVDVLEAAARLVGEANANAVSDLGVAAALAEAGVVGAGLNVRINARGIKDEGTRTELRRQADQAEAAAHRLRAQVIASVLERLGP